MRLTIVIFVKFILLLVHTVQIRAGVFTETPFKGVTWRVNVNETIIWKDDGKVPSLKSLKSMTICLMRGNKTVQTLVMTIATKVRGTDLKRNFVVPRYLGPEGDNYFLRYDYKKYVAFSGQFSIKGITTNKPENPPDKNYNSSTTVMNSIPTSVSTTLENVNSPTTGIGIGAKPTALPRELSSAPSSMSSSSSWMALVIVVLISVFFLD